MASTCSTAAGSTSISLDPRRRIACASRGPDGTREISARWVVDASGRAGLLKRQLGLVRPSTHGANASWWRVQARVKIDDWSSDPAWRARVPSGLRWQSTVHLMGAGYWVWLIPLGSGSHSFGIVADGDLHPVPPHQPVRARDGLAARVRAAVRRGDGRARAGELEDFLALQHFAHGCARVVLADRWALVGEAGVFTDPFYSPGSDFIAMGNDYATDLIVRDVAARTSRARAESFNTTYLRLFDAFIRLYDGQYPIMGNAQVMTAKVAWDNACYWAITALLFFQRRLRQPEFMASIEPLMRRFFVLHARMQQFFRAWDRADAGTHYAPASPNVVDVEFLRAWQASLGDEAIDDDCLRKRLEDNFAVLEVFARTWHVRAAERHGGLPWFVARPAAGEPLLDIAPLRLTPILELVAQAFRPPGTPTPRASRSPSRCRRNRARSRPRSGYGRPAPRSPTMSRRQSSSVSA